MNVQPYSTIRPERRRMTSRIQTSLAAVVSRIGQLRPFGPRPEESMMRFAERGRLSCICVPLRLKMPERRKVCRDCGLPIRVISRNVDRQLDELEIESVVRNLKNGVIQSSGLDLPAEIRTLRQLNAFLASGVEKTRKMPQEASTTSLSQVN